ncbi:MAG: hypothetical protein FWF80_00100, partial [Defluviitaleaceae bacterium]|nr:hypothetical protein [Defluviitaleaceae bacterium]
FVAKNLATLRVAAVFAPRIATKILRPNSQVISGQFLNSNASVIGGKYPFFTCSPEVSAIDHSSLQSKKSGGFTLLELTIALSLWMILSVGVFFVWQHAANAGSDMLEQQYAFENARITMDAILMNLQMAHEITVSRNGDVLETLHVRQLDPDREWDNYRIHFIPSDEIVTMGLRNAANTFATNIAEVRLEYISANRMRVTVVSTCDEPITLVGSVCVRGKSVEMQ